MIRIEGTRFGDIEVAKSAIIRFPAGLVGLPAETDFVLLERSGGNLLALLQSKNTPELVLPVIDGSRFEGDYPRPNATVLARRAGLGAEDLAVLVVATVPRHGRCLKANLLAPLIIDADCRLGAQVVLDHRRYSATETFDLHSVAPGAAATSTRQPVPRVAGAAGV